MHHSLVCGSGIWSGIVRGRGVWHLLIDPPRAPPPPPPPPQRTQLSNCPRWIPGQLWLGSFQPHGPYSATRWQRRRRSVAFRGEGVGAAEPPASCALAQLRRSTTASLPLATGSRWKALTSPSTSHSNSMAGNGPTLRDENSRRRTTTLQTAQWRRTKQHRRHATQWRSLAGDGRILWGKIPPWGTGTPVHGHGARGDA